MFNEPFQVQILFKKFQVKTCFLNKILKNLNKKLTKEPSKHSPWWRRTEDVLKTSWRHNCKTSCKHVLKTSWRGFRKTYCKYVFKTSWKTKSVTLKTSSRRLGKQEMFAGRERSVLWRSPCWNYAEYLIFR